MSASAPLAAVAKSREVTEFLDQPGTAAYIVRRDPGHDGVIVWASPSLQEMLGFRPADVVGRNAWGVLLAPEDVPPAAEYSARMSEGDLTAWAPLRTAAGRKLWVHFEALNRGGGVVILLRPEPDASHHHFHGYTRQAR